MRVFFYHAPPQGSNWIEEKNSQIIRAACRAVGLDDWNDGSTPYSAYECDIDNQVRACACFDSSSYAVLQIPWRTMDANGAPAGGRGRRRRAPKVRHQQPPPPPAAQGTAAAAAEEGEAAPQQQQPPQEEEEVDDVLVDIRYITFTGDLLSVCRRIANETHHFGPQLAHSDVHGALKVLAGQQIELGACVHHPPPFFF